jgi:hypothetical protein
MATPQSVARSLTLSLSLSLSLSRGNGMSTPQSVARSIALSLARSPARALSLPAWTDEEKAAARISFFASCHARESHTTRWHMLLSTCPGPMYIFLLAGTERVKLSNSYTTHSLVKPGLQHLCRIPHLLLTAVTAPLRPLPFPPCEKLEMRELDAFQRLLLRAPRVSVASSTEV